MSPSRETRRSPIARRGGLAGVWALLTAALLAPTPAAAGGGTCYPPPPKTEQPFCTEIYNPHGQTIPPAGFTTSPGTNPNSGQNDDGFYQVGALLGDTAEPVILSDGCGDGFTGFVYGTFDGGTVVKYTEANGKTPGQEPMAGSKTGNPESDAVDFHLWGEGDLLVCAADQPGNCVCCHVSPPPR